MILFTEDMLDIMLPIAKKYCSSVPVKLMYENIEYRIVAIKSSSMDFESNGSLISVEVGGEIFLENQIVLEYVEKNGKANLTELAKKEILANSF
ncbi:TPA: hypothetical protein ACGUVV_004238 [Vibrio vulnificus]|uniref:Uncharacterized protein n=2 Tax=Vibrio TaxID=662 RepID=A0A9X4FIC7_9VIBR|nr:MULTISPECIES: hypothetical protein [Vibrio]ASG03777.1 hypothetical protein CEJ46_07920 [Vibrio anguillarum]EGQ7990753.1 hypothetical protein [Vibrio vulnificus]EGQ9302260.1 hypothetical protein [Vibrio vulnificus]EGR0107064.1 hypothetical protein [Vibrio vulnificus]EGR7943993.1 hypothetical protein [Vibrio vulnificus]